MRVAISLQRAQRSTILTSPHHLTMKTQAPRRLAFNKHGQ